MQVAEGIYSLGSYIERTRIFKQFKYAASGILAILCLMLLSTSAFADCGVVAGTKATGIKLPALVQAGPRVAGMLKNLDDGLGNDSIVGLWQTKYTTGGALFAQSFKQWHSDGTELDLIDQNPLLGSVCLGVWKQTGLRQVRLHHVGWVYAADGTPAGSFTLDETDTVSANGNSYAGTFTFRIYDTNGNFTGQEVNGNTAATRITVN